MAKVVKILALAKKPEKVQSILNWSPFKVDSLSAIIDNVNYEINNKFSQVHQLYLESLVNIFPVGYHLSNINEMPYSEYNWIRLILIDLKDIHEEKGPLEKVKNDLMILMKQRIHLGQINPTQQQSSISTFFAPLFIVKSKPEILPDENKFKEWLINFCENYQFVSENFEKKIVENNQYISHHSENELYKRVEEVQDFSMKYKLSKKGIRELASNAAVQEISLINLGEQVFREKGLYPDLDALRTPVEKLWTQPPLPGVILQSIIPKEIENNLLLVQLASPYTHLNDKQKNMVKELGIAIMGKPKIIMDSYPIREKIDELSGATEVIRFSAKLIDFD